MEITSLIKNSAAATRIVSLSDGDVFKMLHKDYSGERIVYGLVTGVLNNGTATAVTYMRIDPEGMTKISNSVLSDGTDAAIFPATPEEVEVMIDDLQEKAAIGVKNAEEGLQRERHRRELVHDLAARIASRELAATVYEELTP